MKWFWWATDVFVIVVLFCFTFSHFGRPGLRELEMFLLCITAASYRAHKLLDEVKA